MKVLLNKKYILSYLIVFGFLFGLLICELSIRFFYTLREKKICNSHPAYFEKCENYIFYDYITKIRFYSKTGYRPIEGWVGKGVRIDNNGLRTDKNINKNSSNVVLVSGGSTAFGAGVKQSDLFTENLNNTVSAGVGGYVFANEFNFVRDILIDRINFDYWISFSGYNDIYGAYRGLDYFNSPDMFNLEKLIYYANKEIGFNKYIPKLRYNIDKTKSSLDYNDYSVKFYWVINRLLVKSGLKKLQYEKEVETLDEKIILDIKPVEYNLFFSKLKNEILLANSWCKNNGIKFIYILQPSLHSTKKNLTNFEAKIYEEANQKHPGMNNYFSDFYIKLDSDIKNLANSNGFLFINADEFIRDGYEQETFFVDYVHFGSRGNAAIAEGLKVFLKSIK